MGPILLLDKSSLESLSQPETAMLGRYFFLNVPFILTDEIRADLAQRATRETAPEDRVRIVADKLPPTDWARNAYWRDLCILSLSGATVPMLGRVIPPKALGYTTETGKRAVCIPVNPEDMMLANWQEGDFSEADRYIAGTMRDAKNRINLEVLKTNIIDSFSSLPKIQDFEHLGSVVDELLSLPEPSIQLSHLKNFMTSIEVQQNQRDKICKRWLDERTPMFRTFAPYAYYCFRADAIFVLGLAFDKISTSKRRANSVDLMYVYYLPFCDVFSSSDHFHEDICPLFLRSDQEFVKGEDLKKDLSDMVANRGNLDDQHRKEWDQKYGVYPPPSPTSITYRLWKKFMGNPNGPYDEG